MRYLFPRHRCVGNGCIGDQIEKIAEELVEVSDADTIEEMAMETCDVIHACETLLRILEEHEGVDAGNAAMRAVVKNEGRGYYADDDMMEWVYGKGLSI